MRVCAYACPYYEGRDGGGNIAVGGDCRAEAGVELRGGGKWSKGLPVVFDSRGVPTPPRLLGGDINRSTAARCLEGVIAGVRGWGKHAVKRLHRYEYASINGDSIGLSLPAQLDNVERNVLACEGVGLHGPSNTKTEPLTSYRRAVQRDDVLVSSGDSSLG